MRFGGLIIDTVVCLTLAKWETVSGQFGGWRFKVKMIGESKTDKVECPAMGPTAAHIWFGSELELRRPA